MKCIAIILIVLAYWPLMLDCSVSGRYAFALTHAFPMKTYSTSGAFTMGTAVLQVLPTPRIAYHNNAGQSARWFDSTISIWTRLQVTPACGLSGIGYASFDLTLRQLQTSWSCVRHWWRIGPIWLFEATVSFTIYLLFCLAVGMIALLPKHNVEQHAVVAHPRRKPKFVEGTTGIGGSAESDVHELVTKNQPSNNVFTLEGRLVVFSEPATLNGTIDWAVLFHPCQYYHRAESSNRTAQLGVVDERLLYMLFRGVSAYHPWSWNRPSIFVDLPGKVVKQFHAGRGPVVVARIAGVRVVPKRTALGQTIQCRVVVAHAAKRPTFASCIDRHGGPPKPAVISNSLDLTSTTAVTNLPPSGPRTPEFTTIVDCAAPSIHTTVAPLQLGTVADPEALRPVALDQPDDRSCAIDEAVYTNSEERVESSEEPLYSFYGHAPSSGEAESFTASPETTPSSSCTSRTSQDIEGLYPTSDSLFHEQRTAVIHELRSLFPLLEEPASQRCALRTWENVWTRATEQTKVEETRTEDDDQEAEVHTRRKRRGGKKNTCWKNKRRQDKDDYERHPGAGPSGVR